MKVSCICLTYNRYPARVYLLEEAVQSFLQQSWKDKELLIINDCPTQTIKFEHPEVKVINLPARFRTYGEKMAFAVAIASGDYLAPWDDDDICLPMRLEMAVDSLTKLKAQHYKAHGQWFLNRDGLTRMSSFVGHTSAVFSRKIYLKAGGYPLLSLGADVVIDRAMKNIEPPATGEIAKEQWQYIYRWGVSQLHMSSIVENGNPEKSWEEAAQRPVKPGEFTLEPKWLYNYSNLVNEASRSGLTVYPTPDLVFWDK